MKTLNELINKSDAYDSKLKEVVDATWDEISRDVQIRKLNQSMIFDQGRRQRILTQLHSRPQLLVNLVKVCRDNGIDIKTIVEVGTAEGLQSLSFARAFPDCEIYTCDIKDVRHIETDRHDCINFYLGNAQVMAEQIVDDSVDLFWIDGAHDHYAVLDDYLTLARTAKKGAIWAFDDFDKRFGCFYDIQLLARHFHQVVALDLGETASGNPNRIVLMRGRK